MGNPTDAKRELRRELRSARRAVPDQAERSAEICRRLAGLDELSDAALVMVYEPVPGEPDLAALVEWCRERGVATVAPSADPTADDPVDPMSVDVVVAPGLGFTRDGRRLGQGGGWYDRFLARCRPSCTKIGVCFDEQLLDDLPTEPHDVPLDLVVTPTTTHPH